MKKILFIVMFISYLNSSTLNLSISSNPSRLNPILSNDSASSEISSWLFNGLFKYDKHANIVPDLVDTYKFITPKKLYIKLKKNVLWHDGIEFSSKDVLFTYEQIINPKVFNSLKSNFKEIKNVKIIDKFTLEINYKKPYFKALQIWMIGMLPYHILKNEKNLMTSAFNRNPIGTGSYILKEFKFGEDIELIANKNFYEGKPKIDKILYRFLPDTNTSFLFLKQKKIDLANLTPIQIDRQLGNNFKKNFKILEKPSFGYSYLGFNLKNKKFKNIKVRKALSLAIDRKELVDILFFGHASVCNGPFLPGTFAYNESVKPVEQNIKKAKKLLEEAGYTKEKPLEFEVVTNTGNSLRINAAQILQYQLEKVGVKMRIRVMEWQAFLNTVVIPRKFETILLAWSLALMPDAYPLWHSDSSRLGGFNLVNYKDKEVDKLIERAVNVIDKKELGKIYKKIFLKITESIPYLFLYIPNSITVVDKNIKNIEPSLIGIMHNQKDWIKE